MKLFFNLTDISNIKRITFRQDINGLRAIAVLSVVFYHADFSIFKGGWLGVDIFFVISGYLISNIIISEFNDKTFSFKVFYTRRIKRIIPALFSTLFFTLFFTYFFLTPKATLEFIESLIATIFFYANYHFMNLDFYIAESAKAMPLLHTWSLAIEEQYYLIFPLLVLFLYKYFKKYLTFFIGIIVIISLYLNTLSQSSEKFYRLEFRIWELLLGVLVMIISSNFKIKNLEKIGFPLMFFPIFYFDETWINDTEPKLIALTGISLIIFSNTDKTNLSKVLSLKPVSIIGLSSYSIYLVHQPIFAFYKIYKNTYQELSFYSKANILDSFLLCFVSIVFGYFQYKYVEMRIPKQKKYSNFLIFSMVFFLLFSLIGESLYGFKNRFKNSDLSMVAIDYQNIDSFDLIIDNQVCHKLSIKEEIDELCVANKYKDSKDILVVGDSHSRTFLKPFSKEINNYKISFATGSSCIFFTNKINPKCVRSDQSEIINLLNYSEGKIIIYFADLQDKIYDIERDVLKNVPITINRLAERNKLIIVKQLPLFPVNVGNRIIISKGKTEVKYPTIEWQNNSNRIKVEEMYESLESENIFFIETFEIFCNNIQKNYCVGADLNNIYFYDDNHLTEKGSKLIIDKVIEILELIENN